MTAYEATSYLIDVVLDEWEVRLCMIIPSIWIECFQELYISSIQKHKFIYEILKQIVTLMTCFVYITWLLSPYHDTQLSNL